MTDRSSDVGERVPEFRLPASTGHTLESSSFLGKVPVVYVFLDPTAQWDHELLVSVDSRLKEFGDERSQLLVIAPIDEREAKRLTEELGLTVPILADAGERMAGDFGVAESGASAIVSDKDGVLVRRFDPLPKADDPTDVVESLLYAVRAIGGSYLLTGSTQSRDAEFFARIAEEAGIPLEEAPGLVSRFLRALAPWLSAEAVSVIDEIAPAEVDLAHHDDGSDDDDALDAVLSATPEGPEAGKSGMLARVIAEALSDRADAHQLRRLEESIDDEDLLALFERVRGEMTHQQPPARPADSTVSLT